MAAMPIYGKSPSGTGGLISTWRMDMTTVLQRVDMTLDGKINIGRLSI